MALSPVYLDHNATTPVSDVACDAVAEALRLTGNPSSVHRHGARARNLVDSARDAILALAGAHDADVIFTSGGTEANNLALFGIERALFVSAIEHASILAAAREVDRPVTVLPVTREGVLDLGALETTLIEGSRPGMVSLMLANNETGVIQPVREAASLAHTHGALLHCDAVQGPGKIAVDMDGMGIDLLTLSAHKCGGPMGVGALVTRRGVTIDGVQVGGGQENYRRAGTPNVPGIAGFAAAARSVSGQTKAIAALCDALERRCVELGGEVIGATAERLPNTTCLTMPGVNSETQMMAFDLDGIAVSAGAACSSGKVGPSHVLAAMGVSRAMAESAIRVSLGPTNGTSDIDRFVHSWSVLFERKRADEEARLAS